MSTNQGTPEESFFSSLGKRGLVLFWDLRIALPIGILLGCALAAPSIPLGTRRHEACAICRQERATITWQWPWGVEQTVSDTACSRWMAEQPWGKHEHLWQDAGVTGFLNIFRTSAGVGGEGAGGFFRLSPEEQQAIYERAKDPQAVMARFAQLRAAMAVRDWAKCHAILAELRAR